MIGGNKPNIKSLKGLNLFPKGTLESKLLNPTNGYEWSLNAFRNYFFFGDDNSPITKLTKKCYHELGEGVIDPVKFFLENKEILRNLIGQYLGFYFFYFTNKEDIDRLIQIGKHYHKKGNWPRNQNIEESIKNILRKIEGSAFNESASIYKDGDKQLSDPIKAKIDKYLKFSPTIVVVSGSELSSPESSDSESSASDQDLNKKQNKNLKDVFGKIFKMSTTKENTKENDHGPEYNLDELEGIFSIALSILWEIADDKSGIKKYYEGLNEYISVDIPLDFESTEYTISQLQDYDASISEDYNYISAYLNSKINKILSIQQQQYPKFELNNGEKIDYADCGEISLKNFIKILCFDKATDLFDINKLSLLEPIHDITIFFRTFNRDDLHSSDVEKEISFTSGYTAKMNSRNAWAYLVSNREGVRYRQVKKGFRYEIDQGTVNGEPNMLILLKQLFKKSNLKWEDFDKDIDVDLEDGFGTILFKNSSYKWEFLHGHYQTNISKNKDPNQILPFNIEDEKLIYLYNLIDVSESFNRKLFYHYDWKENNILLLYFNMLTKNIDSKDLEYTRLFKYIHKKFDYDQKRRTELDLSKLDIDGYLFNTDLYNIVKYNDFDINLQSLTLGGKFNESLGNSLDNLVNLQSLTFGNDFSQPLGNSLDNLVNLKSLTLSYMFNLSLGNSLDNLVNLQSLTFGSKFNKSLGNSLDNLVNLHSLTFGNYFEVPLGNSLDNLVNLHSLTFGSYFNLPLGNSLDKLTNLQTLKFGKYFNVPLGNSLDNLTNLQSLTFGMYFSQPLDNSLDSLTNLESLSNINDLHLSFDRLTNLQSLKFGSRFNESLGNSLDNLVNLRSLTFEEKFNKPLDNSLYNLINLQSLTFGDNFDVSLDNSLFNSLSLQSLTFGDSFNKPLSNSLDNLTNLQSLIFGTHFKQSLGYSLDKLTNLQSLEFGYNFDQSLDDSLDSLTNLQSLTFGYNFNKPLGESLYKLTKLQSLTFGSKFNEPLGNRLDSLTNLQSLQFGHDFNKYLSNSLNNLTSLKSLTFGYSFNQPLDTSLDKLTNLQSLTFGDNFEESLGNSLDNLTNLQSLTFGMYFNQPLDTSLGNLTNLQSLNFGIYFNQPLDTSLDKLTSLQSLTFGNYFNVPLGNSLDKLISLQSLIFGNYFNQPLGNSLDNLKKLQLLTFGQHFNQPLGNSLDNLINLKYLTFGQEFNHPLIKILEKFTNLQSLNIKQNYSYFLKKNQNITVVFN